MTTELLQVSDIKFKFVNVSEVMEAELKKAVDHQIANKGQTILKKIIDYTIIKNKSWLYEADFVFNYNGERFVVENHKGFKVASDLITHAFDKWKRKVLGFWGFLSR